jgi:hypothetical protein
VNERGSAVLLLSSLGCSQLRRSFSPAEDGSVAGLEPALTGVQRHSSRAGQRAKLQGLMTPGTGRCSVVHQPCKVGVPTGLLGVGNHALTTIGTVAQTPCRVLPALSSLGHTAKWCSSMAAVKGDIRRCRLAIAKATRRDIYTAVWHTLATTLGYLHRCTAAAWVVQGGG